MIPNFLQSLAATVRDLVRTGKAVHVTNATADELDLLAGLPWNKTRVDFACIDEDGTVSGANRKEWTKAITPADLALGWLLASRVHDAEWAAGTQAEGLAYVTAHALKRAAECAELALISVALLPRFEGTEPGVLQSHQGTRTGALAAWGFIHEQIRTEHRGIGLREVGSENLIDRYRRELEAI